jgi:hypothetical protein
MRSSLRFLSACLTAIITLMAALPSSHAQPYGAEQMQPPRDEHAMTRLLRDIDQVKFEIEQIQIYTRYCKPPNGPNIADTQWEIDFVSGKYKRLQATFDRFFEAYEQAIKTRLAAGYRSGFPPLKGMTADHRDYWATISGMLSNLANKIEAKQAALNKKKEEDCADDDRPPPPPPPPPPADWFKGLSRPVAPPVPFAELPPHFCTELEKSQWILKNISPARVLASENARAAADYVVDVGRRMRELEIKRISEPLTADEQRGLKELSAEYKWAQDDLAEQDRVVKEIDAHAAKAWAIKIIDCRTEQPQTGDAQPIPQPDYEMFVYPQVPPRFCSEQEKQSTLSQLQFAKDAARRNYEKAKAHVATLDARLKAGDNTPGLPESLRQARQTETSYYNLWIELDRAYYRAQAMPVVDCGPPAGDDRGVLRGAEAGAEIGTTAPPPVTPPPQPATGTGKAKEFGIRYEGGYIDTDSPQQFIGRIVVGGDDTAMIYTSPTLAGFYAGAEADFWEQNLRYAGEFSGFRIAASLTDIDGDEYRRVEADPTITTGFVWINPLEPGLPFAVGLGSTNLAWDARTSTEEIDAAAMTLYMQYRGLGPNLTGGVGAGVMADYRSTEHRTRIENLDFAGFAIDENYDFETFGLGPRVEGELRWDCDPEGDGPFPAFGANLRVFAAGTYEWRNSEVAQRATGPFFGGFDVSQRVEFDDDGFNLRYGVNATVDLKFDARTTAFLKLGWQGQSDAPTIVPADGSLAPGAPVRADTQDASEWFIGGGLRIEF